ncbi:MAG TPA: hypothetical protein VH137_10650 [Gemmatimonadales bacterium]|jgi:hypothetical protein|nr:hypothetical protein [Gemmatimonadales bacterium]
MKQLVGRAVLLVLVLVIGLGIRWLLTTANIAACKKVSAQRGVPADTAMCYRVRPWAR